MARVVADVLNVGSNACNIGECFEDKGKIPFNLNANDLITFTYREGKVLGLGGKTFLEDEKNIFEAKFTKYGNVFGVGDTIEVDPASVTKDGKPVPGKYTYFYVNRIKDDGTLRVIGGDRVTESFASAKTTMETILRPVKNVAIQVIDPNDKSNIVPAKELSKDITKATTSLTEVFKYLDPILHYQTCYDELFSEIPDPIYRAPIAQMEILSRLTKNLKDSNQNLLRVSDIKTCIQNINLDKVEFFKMSGDAKKLQAKVKLIFDKYGSVGASQALNIELFYNQIASKTFFKDVDTIKGQYFTFIGFINASDKGVISNDASKTIMYRPVALLPNGKYTDFVDNKRDIFPKTVIEVTLDGKQIKIILFAFDVYGTGYMEYKSTLYSSLFGSRETPIGNNKTVKLMSPAQPISKVMPTTPTPQKVASTLGGKRRTKKIKKNRK